MKKKSKAAAEPTLVFYKKVEWEQMAFRRRREEIMVAVSVLLLLCAYHFWLGCCRHWRYVRCLTRPL